MTMGNDLAAEFRRAESVLSRADISGDPLGAAEIWLIKNTLRKAEDRIQALEAELAAALIEVSNQAQLRGEAEGKLHVSELAGIVEGWQLRAERAEAELARKTEALDKLEAVFQAQQGQAMWAEQDDDGSVAVFYSTPHDERGLVSWNFFPSGTVVVSSTKLGTILNLRAARSALEEKTDV